MKKLPKWAYPVAILSFPLFMVSAIALAVLALIGTVALFIGWCIVGCFVVIPINIFTSLFKYETPRWAEFLFVTDFWPLIDIIIDRIYNRLFRKESIES